MVENRRLEFKQGMSTPEKHPPRWATRLLSWYCKPELLEDLQGDLNEYFYRNLRKKGFARARLTYIIDVIKFFKPYIIRKPQFINILIHWIMIGSYIKTSGRSIVRHKLFSAINIVGLAVSMSVGLLLISLLADMFSYDKFHTHHGRIYRVLSQYQYSGQENLMATTSLNAATAISERSNGVEAVAILRRNFAGDVTFSEKTLPLSGFWANEEFFQVFTFPLLKGDPATALKEPFSVILTETSAKKLFDEGDALGKTVILNNDKAYTVTAIMKDVPKFSHMRFDMLGSLKTRDITEKNNDSEWEWTNIWHAWTYVLLHKDADINSFQDNLDRLSDKENPVSTGARIKFSLQPLDDIMMGENLGNQIGRTLGSTLIWVFSGLAFVVLLSACFNYTNLSIARSLRRAREVGIRKVVGAAKSHVASQFVTEAVIISLLSLVAAFGIFMMLRPHFIDLHADLRELLVLDLTPALVFTFILFAIILGLITGLFPALFFARINALQVLKDATSVRVFQRVTLRKVLIVFQYCLCIMLISGTVIIYKQYRHFVGFDLGFSTDNILNIRLQKNKSDLFIKKLNELPEVQGISQTGMIAGVETYWSVSVKNPKNPEDSATVLGNVVDEHYIPLLEHQLLAGRNFTPHAEDAIESEVIVNQQLLKRFQIADQNPSDAIGEVLTVEGKDLKIAGVIRDFQYGKVSNVMQQEVMLRYSAKDQNHLHVKVLPGDRHAVYEKIETIWKEIDNSHPFHALFYDDEIKETFSGMSASMKLTGFVSMLAICIASMGLLGMVVFTTETRIREISIRKVLGAGEGTLVFVLGKGFLVLLVIAITIALPITYLFFDQVMLPNLANHAPLSLGDGLFGTLTVVAIALVVIGTQTLKVARTNPADVLKTE